MKTKSCQLLLQGKAMLCAAGFLFCQLSLIAQPSVDYGKSYVNITKGPGGGTNEPGDTLEIRAVFVVSAGTAYQCSYSDNLPAGTSYIPNTLRVLTNEGKIFRQWTDGAGDDAGTITSTGAITIGLGTGAGVSGGGAIKNTDKPSFGSTCIMVASYRVRIDPALSYGAYLNVGLGGFVYSNAVSPAAVNTVSFSPDTVMLYKNYGICPNTVGSNAILSESGGTFGSGQAKNRAASAKVPANYTYTLFASLNPNDYYYGVSNNTSPGGSGGYTVLNTWGIPDAHRVFQTWDVIGDHTNAADPFLGNPPTDTTTGSGGYMVVINASYRTDTAFKDVVTNLCPDTYYQYTAWFRNIGPKGSTDSNGVSAVSGNSSYIPTGPGDSSGVHPNLTFNANGYDYYTTGDIAYTGKWVQKGFTFKTGPAQNQMTIYIRNNAPGGGGNDWAIDDISVASCSPNIQLTPDKPDTICQGQDDTVRFKVSSYFNDYSQWQIEQSTNGGGSWTMATTDTTGQASAGISSPVYSSLTGQYEYTVTRYYRLDAVNTLIQYRIRVASSAANLASASCSFVGTTAKVIHAVNCNVVLPVTILSFRGESREEHARLRWVSADETADTKYIIEKSVDRSRFEEAGSVEGAGVNGGSASYQFTDPVSLGGPVYYRIRIVSGGLNKYSTVVLLSNTALGMEISALINPFTDRISFDLVIPDADAGDGDGAAIGEGSGNINGQAAFHLIDLYGRAVLKNTRNVSQGLNHVELQGLGVLPAGMYILQVQYAGNQMVRQVVKIAKR